MQLFCFNCRQPMVVPDQAAHFGGVFTCPTCRATNTVAATAMAANAWPAGTYPAGAPQAVNKQQDNRRGVALAIVFGVVVLSVLAPAVGIPIGLLLLGWGVLAAAKHKASLLSLILPPAQGQVVLRGVLTAAIGVLGLTCSGVSISANRDREQREAREAQERAEAAEQAKREQEEEARRVAAEEAARIAQLRADAETVAKKGDAEISNIAALIDGGKWDEAETSLAALDEELAAYRDLDPVPPNVADAMSRRSELAETVKKVQDIRHAGRDLLAATKTFEDAFVSKSWRDAKTTAATALGYVRTLENADGSLAAHVPADLDLERTRASIEKKLKRVDKEIEKLERAEAKEAERRRQAEARAAAFRALCGEPPQCGGGWDGECIGLEFVLQQSAHDPDSIDVENCTPAVLTDKHCWVTTCNVRGRNMFGAMILQRNRYSKSALGWEEL